MNYKKIILAISFLVVFGFLFNYGLPNAEAATAAEIQTLIQQLQQQIAQLQQQLAELTGKPAAWCHAFKVNLKYGMNGAEVSALQIALEREGFTIPESEKTPVARFEDFTASAVVGFQEKYKGDILAPWGLEHGTGYVGPTTRAKLNKLYGCGVVTPYIKVISPNGGEKWEGGKTYNITWASKGVEKVNILIYDYTPSKVVSETIAINIPATQSSYSWKVPSDPSTLGPSALYWGWKLGDNYKIGIVGGKAVDDESDNYFSIVSPTTPSITVLSPNGGEKWEIGKIYRIEWKISGIDRPYFNVYLEDWGGLANSFKGRWQMGKNVYGTYMDWKVPSDLLAVGPIRPDDTYLIRIENVDNPSVYDNSDSYFSIVSPTTACTDSDGGKNYYTKGTVTDSGKTYTDYCMNSTLKEYFCLPISALGLGGVAEENYTCPYGCSNGACLGVVTPYIKVLSPNGGEKWTVDNTYQIFWESTGIVQTDKIRVAVVDYTFSYPTEYDLVYNLAGNLGAYSWAIPTNFNTAFKYKIKVEGCKTTNGITNCYSDLSDNYFSITAATTPLTVTFPSAGSILNQGSTYNITWTGSDAGVSSYSVYLVGGSLGSAGAKYLGIAYASQKSFSWTVPSDITPGSGYQIQLSGAGATGDNSDSFSIAVPTTPSITITSPNGGERWEAGKPHNIVWESRGYSSTDKIRVAIVDYSNTINAVEYDIVYNLAGNIGFYLWTIPSNFNVNSKYKIKVEICGGGKCYSDQSDNYFSIVD